MDKNEINVSLNIECKSWLKDTEDLFDFETKEIKSKIFYLSNEDKLSYIISTINENNEDEILLMNTVKNLEEKISLNPKKTKIITEINYNKQNSNFKFINPLHSENYNKIFYKENCERIWKNLSKENETEINEGDIIKLGRVRLKFDKIIFNNSQRNNTVNTGINNFNSNSNQNNLNNSNNITNIIFNNSITGDLSNNDLNDYKNNLNENKFICRICYRNESNINDPLISPCKCSGSMSYIHFKCLKSCIEAKIHKKKDEKYEIYTWKSFNCEICLYPYPKYINYKNKKYFLVDIDTSRFNQFCVCDYSLFDDNQKKAFHRGYLIIGIEDDYEINIGRNQSNGVKLKDISVSRKHCYIIKKNDKLYIKDLNSKFGTLKYIKDKYEVELYNELDALSGKHRFNILLSKKWNFFGLSNLFKFGCCSYKQTNDNEQFIFEENKNISENKRNTNNKNIIQCDGGIFKYKDDDSYNDYVLYMNKINGIPDDGNEGNNINTNTHNNQPKEDDYN